MVGSSAYMSYVSVQTRLVLGTLCVFNGIVLAVLAIASLVFVDGVMRFVGGAGLGLAAVALFGLARRLRRGVEWR